MIDQLLNMSYTLKVQLGVKSMDKQDLINKIIAKINEIGDSELNTLFYQLITEEKKLYAELYLDELSKLYNRKALKFINNCSGVVMIDIDDFKAINDNFGHHTGDYVIRNISKIILNNIRSCDTAIRYGGDEILIFFCNCSESIIESRIQKIKAEIKEKIKLPNTSITLSVGIAMNLDNEAIAFLINNADTAMYKSKKNGKDLITKYNDNALKKTYSV